MKTSLICLSCFPFFVIYEFLFFFCGSDVQTPSRVLALPMLYPTCSIFHSKSSLPTSFMINYLPSSNSIKCIPSLNVHFSKIWIIYKCVPHVTKLHEGVVAGICLLLTSSPEIAMFPCQRVLSITDFLFWSNITFLFFTIYLHRM